MSCLSLRNLDILMIGCLGFFLLFIVFDPYKSPDQIKRNDKIII